MTTGEWAGIGVSLLGVLFIPGGVTIVRLWSDVSQLKQREAVNSSDLNQVKGLVMDIRERLIRMETRAEDRREHHP